MADRLQFKEKLAGVLALAEDQNGKITVDEVEKYFEEDGLSQEQMNLVCDYLLSMKMAVVGYKQTGGTVKEAEKEEKQPLSAEEQKYVEEYLRGLGDMKEETQEEVRMAYYLPKVVEEAVRLHHPEVFIGDMIQEGDILGEVRDYEGKVKEVSEAEFDGVILYQTGTLQVVGNGPMVTYGRIVSRYDERKERIVNYWEKRSDSFLEQRRAELHSALAGRWMAELKKYLPEKKNLRILDVGCGTGFFTILLAKEGHQVTGIDLTPDMITHAKELAEEEKADCRFMVMDAEAPDFPDEEFDVIVSRNLTWTLPDAEHAYQEWFRVLKPGGVMINLDANYGAADFADTADLPENHAHHQIQDELMQECEDIKRQLPISSFLRPAWDLETLSRIGVEEFSFDLGISKRIYTEKDEFYNPTPMFLIFAKKQR